MNKANITVMIVDDILENRRLIAEILTKNTDYNIQMIKNGSIIQDLLEKNEFNPPDLILLDVMMPNIDGYSLAKMLNANIKTKNIPIIFLTALSEMKSKVQAFKNGGVDYISKPFYKEELLSRISAHVKIKKLNDELVKKNQMLENEEIHLLHLVEEKTMRMEKLTLSVVKVLENANLFNDDNTGNHIKRVSSYSELLASKCKCNSLFVSKIRLFSSLHDIGKIGIPNNILKKPAKLTKSEFEKMKEHVEIGYKILENEEIDQMAKNIVRYHHEKWDGSGYGKGLIGKDIPLEARIVALADVYDALTTERVYKAAFSHEKSLEIIISGKGSQFDPDIVDVFLDCIDEIKLIREKYC